MLVPLFLLSIFQNMERLSMLAFHPVKMQSCYEKVDQLNLEGLQQRFEVSSPSVFVSRAQILMREVSCCSDCLCYNTENQLILKQAQDAWQHSLVSTETTHGSNFMPVVRSLLTPAGQNEYDNLKRWTVWAELRNGVLSQYHQSVSCATVKQIFPLLWQQMDNAVYTFEQLFHQSLEAQGEEDMCKTIQRCQDRVLKVK